jgi:hypothetical protein
LKINQFGNAVPVLPDVQHVILIQQIAKLVARVIIKVEIHVFNLAQKDNLQIRELRAVNTVRLHAMNAQEAI